MIQRKQTIFLLLSMLVIALSFFFPILGVEGAVGQEDLLFNLSAMGGTMSGNIGLFITMLAAFLLNGAAIFAYKERRKQMKMILGGVALMVIWYILIAITIHWADVRLYHWHLSAILPLLVINVPFRAMRVGRTQSIISMPLIKPSTRQSGEPTPIRYLGLSSGR